MSVFKAKKNKETHLDTEEEERKSLLELSSVKLVEAELNRIIKSSAAGATDVKPLKGECSQPASALQRAPTIPRDVSHLSAYMKPIVL